MCQGFNLFCKVTKIFNIKVLLKVDPFLIYLRVWQGICMCVCFISANLLHLPSSFLPLQNVSSCCLPVLAFWAVASLRQCQLWCGIQADMLSRTFTPVFCLVLVNLTS